MKKIMLLACLLMLCTVCSAFAATTTYTGVCDPIVIDQPGEHIIILDGVTINAKNCDAISIKAPATKVTVILKDGTVNSLFGGTYDASEFGYAAIANGSTALVIRCESAGDGHVCDERCGLIYARGAESGGWGDSAAIGSGFGEDMSGSITILGGIIEASSGDGAGIGSGTGGNMNGTVTIAGGTVSAYSSFDAAGIGGGEDGDMSGSVIIKGGIVEAIAEHRGAGIGSGRDGDMSGSITIKEGIVAARTHGMGAGIGSGMDGNMSGSFTVKGGIVTVASYYENVPAIGASGNGTVTEDAVICVDPDRGWIEVGARANNDELTSLANSPYNVRTDLKSLLNGKNYAKFRSAEPQITPAPVLPSTGDGMNPAALAVLAAVSLMGMAMIVRKKCEA